MPYSSNERVSSSIVFSFSGSIEEEFISVKKKSETAAICCSLALQRRR
jgi:hypothetical protein